VVQGGQQLAHGKIAGTAKYDQVEVIDRKKLSHHQFPDIF
jgi:hypothetical protein